MRVWDISTPIGPTTAVFPGDPLVQVTRTHAIDRGDPYNVSSVTMGTHTGTHVDPPVHFLPGGDPIDRVDPRRLNGRARVVSVAATLRRIDAASVPRLPPGTTRVLFHTANSERWAASEAFFDDYVALDDGAAEALLGQGAELVGVDSLSIESDPTGRYPVHHRLLAGGALILEGLRLAGVPDGDYELRCLPLRLYEGDGGPARAILLGP